MIRLFAFLLLSLTISPLISMAQDDVAMKDAVCKLLALQNEKSFLRNKVASATYQEGIDAYGNAVVPANVDTAAPKQSIFIPIEIDLAQKFDIPNIENLGEANIGTAEIEPSGRVLFNQNDVTSKMHDWCGTPVPEEIDIIAKPEIQKPKIQTQEINGPMVEVTTPEKPVVIKPIEVKPASAIPPIEVNNNDAPNDPKMTQSSTTLSDTITGTDFRDYNE